VLCFVTNRASVVHGDLIDLIYSVKQTNIGRIILREKDMSPNKLLEMALAIRKALEGTTTQLMINGSVEVATKVSADGVHFPFDLFKETSNRYGLTGVSVHSVEEALYAEKNGADYLIAGHIYLTSCKAGLKPRGVEYLSEICNSVSIPVIGIGGISPRHIPEVINNGAKGIAVMSPINGAVNPVQKIRDYQAGLKIFADEI